MASWNASEGEATGHSGKSRRAAGLKESVTDSQTKTNLHTRSVGTKTQQSGMNCAPRSLTEFAMESWSKPGSD